MSNLKDKIVVISGASSGIGLESSVKFAEAGAHLALLARNPERLEAAGRRVESAGAKVMTLVADVTDETAVAGAIAAVQKSLGPVDILVNNAGVGFATDLAKCSIEDFRKIMDTNLTGVFLLTRAVLPEMKERKAGHVINISSIVGKVANPNAPLYCASKHALNGYTSGLQQQVAKDGIRVSLVSPSAADTAYWDGREVDRSKFLQASEVADVVLFVANQPPGVLIKDVDLSALR